MYIIVKLLAGGIVTGPDVVLPDTVPVYVTVIDKYAPLLFRNTQYALLSVVLVDTGNVIAENAEFVIL